MEYPISIIRHNQNDVTKLYDSSDPRYGDLTILSEHYYYHKHTMYYTKVYQKTIE